jgi:rhomboid domain-containing protein 1
MIYYQVVIIGINIITFLISYENRYRYLSDYSLIPYNVIEKGEYYRIFSHCLLHGNFFHLLMNMNALIRILPMLIRVKQNFILMMVVLLFSYNIVYIGISIILNKYFNYNYLYYSSVIGFSGILFGLVYINSLINYGGYFVFMGHMIPHKYYPIFVLFVSQIVMPNVSFLGHFSGIIAGIITSKLIFN